MTKKAWMPEREAALVAKAERGFNEDGLGSPVPNPLRKAGRPSLSPEGGESKALNARIPSDLHLRVTAFAKKTGRSVSDVTRDALTSLLNEDAATPEPKSKRKPQPRPRRA